MNCCEWCQAETELLVPVINRDPTRSHEQDLVCPTCAELEAKYNQITNQGWEVIQFLSMIGSHAQEVI